MKGVWVKMLRGRRGGEGETRGSQERPKRLQEAPKSPPEGSKRASRDPKSRSRGLYNSKDALLRCPATECKTGMPKNGGRAAVMPLGARQSAARPGGAEQGVLDRQPKAEATAKAPNLKAIICLRYLQSSKSEFLPPL